MKSLKTHTLKNRIFILPLLFIGIFQSGFATSLQNSEDDKNNNSDTNMFIEINALEEQGNYRDALKELNQMVVQSPNNYLILDRRGVMYTRMQKYNKALHDFQTVIKINPDYAGVYNHRAIMNFSLGNLKLAQIDFNRAITLQEDYAKAYYNRALLELASGNDKEALEDFAMAQKYDYAKAGEAIEEYFANK